MSKPGNGSKPKHKAKAAARKKQPVSKKPKAMKHKQLGSFIDGLLRRQAAEIGKQRLSPGPETVTGAEAEIGTYQITFEDMTISYPEPMFRDTAESRLLLATTRSRFMHEMLAVYDRYAEAARNRYNEMDSTVNRPQIQPMGLMLVDTTAAAGVLNYNAAAGTESEAEAEAEAEADGVPGDYCDEVAGWGAI